MLKRQKNSSSVRDFSCQLNQYIINLGRNRQKQKYQKFIEINRSQDSLLFPDIKFPKTKNKHKQIHGLKNSISIQNKLDKLQHRLNNIKKSNQSFWQGQPRVPQSKLRKPPNHRPQPMPSLYQALTPPPYYLQNPPYYPYSYPSSQSSLSPYLNPQKMPNCQNNNVLMPMIQNNGYGCGDGQGVSEERIKYLRTRMRVGFLAVYFVGLFRAYSRAVGYGKCLQFIQVQKNINQQKFHQTLFHCFTPINIAYQYYQAQKKIKQQSTKTDQMQVLCQSQQITISMTIIQQFFQRVIDRIHQLAKKDMFGIFVPVLAGFISGSFPYSGVYLEEELGQLRFRQGTGRLQISLQTTKYLIINLFFIKTFVYYSLKCTNLLQILTQTLKSKKIQITSKQLQQQKYPKKIRIALTLLNQTLNDIYFLNKESKNGNYYELSKKLRVRPMGELAFKFLLGDSVVRREGQKQKLQYRVENLAMIKGIECSSIVKEKFIIQFVENWKKIRLIGNILFKQALEYRNSQIRKILKKTLENKFPTKQKIQQAFNLKYQQINR